eukprot:8733361-Alexandrium_andersonii.AAC.1
MILVSDPHRIHRQLRPMPSFVKPPSCTVKEWREAVEQASVPLFVGAQDALEQASRDRDVEKLWITLTSVMHKTFVSATEVVGGGAVGGGSGEKGRP